MSIDMSYFLKNFNMRNIHKNINIAVIFMLIGMFLLSDAAYALRVPVGIEQERAQILLSHAGSSAGNLKAESKRNIPIKEVKRRLSELVTKPIDFDWEANKESLPDLIGRLGTTNGNGVIYLRPIKNYNFLFHILGFKEEGWEAFIINSGVKNDIYRFTVRLTKNGRAVKRSFQICRYTRNIYGVNSEIGKYEKALAIRRWRNKYPSKASAERALQERNEKGWPNNPGALQEGKHRDVALYEAARKFGIEPPNRRKKHSAVYNRNIGLSLKRIAGRKDYYRALSVTVSATQKEIKTRYRKLSKQLHPDIRITFNEERFKDINEAYRVIGDPEKRRAYDISMSDRIHPGLIRSLEAYLEDPKKAGNLFYFDRESSVRILAVSEDALGEAIGADPVLIPWIVKALNIRLVKQGYNPFLFQSALPLQDSNHNLETVSPEVRQGL